MVNALPSTPRLSAPIKLSVLYTERLEGGLVEGKRRVSKRKKE